MDWQQSESWATSFEQFMSEYDELFVRSEIRDKAKLYVRVLPQREMAKEWTISTFVHHDCFSL